MDHPPVIALRDTLRSHQAGLRAFELAIYAG